MWWAIFTIASYAIKALVALIDWGHERRLIESGRADQQLADAKGRIEAQQSAIAARDAQRRAAAQNPDDDSAFDENLFRKD